MSDIAFLGLGNMGGPMAANLIKAGHLVTGFDPARDAVDRFEAAGGVARGTVPEAVSSAEVVITMLPAGKHVAEVYLEKDGVLAHVPGGALLIDCSTIDVGTARKVEAVAAERGFEMIDAPVSGGVGGAEAATLTFMVGGTAGAVSRAEPLLEVMGATVVHAGDAGAGQAAKICNNMILGISMIGVSEAFVLAEKLGLDADKLFEISSRSSGQCWSLTSYCPVPGPVPASPANRDYKAGFSAAMMLKDLRLARLAALESGSATPLGAEAEALYSLFCGVGGGASDFSAIIRFLRGTDI